MVVVGDSAGGCLTLTTGYRVHPKPKALVAMYSYGELKCRLVHRAKSVSQIQLAENYQGGSDAENGWNSHFGCLAFEKWESGKIYMYYRQTGLWPQEVSGFSPESIAKDIAPYEPVKNVTR